MLFYLVAAGVGWKGTGPVGQVGPFLTAAAVLPRP